jgi:hypothetical protein
MTEEDPAGVTSRYMIDSITIPTCLTKYEDEEKRKKKYGNLAAKLWVMDFVVC